MLNIFVWSFLIIFWLLFYRNGEMSLTLELLRMETDREPMYWPFNASSTGLISAVPHDCPKAIKKATTNTTADPGALVNNNNNNNNNASTKNSVLNGLSQHKRHSYCKYTFFLVLSCQYKFVLYIVQVFMPLNFLKFFMQAIFKYKKLNILIMS